MEIQLSEKDFDKVAEEIITNLDKNLVLRNRPEIFNDLKELENAKSIIKETILGLVIVRKEGKELSTVDKMVNLLISEGLVSKNEIEIIDALQIGFKEVVENLRK